MMNYLWDFSQSEMHILIEWIIINVIIIIIFIVLVPFLLSWFFMIFFLRVENIQLHHPNLKLNLRSLYKRLVDFPLGWWNQPVQKQGLHWRRKETEREKLLQVKYHTVNSRSFPSSKTLTFIARLSAKPLFWKWV